MPSSGLDDSPRLIRELLDRRGLALKKRWGQNFMIAASARERIVAELHPQSGEVVWEVGSGLGAITALLVGRGTDVTVFEVDYGLMKVIEERFGATVRIVAGDAVKTIPEQAAAPDRIVGNLPYRSAAAIISSILEAPHILGRVKRLVFTVQREMAQRIVARTRTSDYSPFSVLCQVTTRPRLAGDLSRGNFYPAPDVVSSIVALEPTPVDPAVRALCATAARSLFAQRRKTVANNAAGLAAALRRPVDEVKRVLSIAGVDLSSRAEEVAPERFLELARRLADEFPDYSG